MTTASKMADGPRVSPLGDHRQEKTIDNSQAAERQLGQILEGHDLAEDSSRQANLETAY